MKKSIFIIILLIISHGILIAQVVISDGPSTPASSSVLDVQSDGSGFLPPRMTEEQRNAIPAPAEGLMVFCTDCGYDHAGMTSVYINGNWRLLAIECTIPQAPVQGTHTPSGSQIIWRWNTVSGATGYKWNTVNDYATATDMLNGTSKTETGLSPGPYTRYVWAYNVCGHSTVAVLNATLPFAVGQAYGGGIIFYLDGTGQHGLIAAPADQGIYEWGCGGYWDGVFLGATGWSIGYGQSNTTIIVNGCGTPNIAARICNNLVLNGYDDWFLPSMGELALMRQLSSVIGGFVNGYPYWSSTEFSYSAAFGYYFGSASDPYTFSKYQGKFVRAIRDF
jgi:hypothetical protein